jgi:hypothetical protein
MSNITFLIGNGFDVNLGLKTRYTDFYEYYFKSVDNSDVSDCVKRFAKKIEKNYETWSDFESAFGKNIEGTQFEVRDILYHFNTEFSNYLEKQEKLCQYDDENISTNFRMFLTNSYKQLEQWDRIIFEDFFNTIGSISSKEDISIYFVDFNYTTVLDNLVKKFLNDNSGKSIVLSTQNYTEHLSTILHIHGKIGENIIIGVDSLKQIDNAMLSSNESLARYCVKSAINNSLGQSNIEQNFKYIVNSSVIIYTYGINFGETDRSRWEIIKAWIKKNPSNRLVIFKYKTNFDKYYHAYQLLLQDEINKEKSKFLCKLGFEENECENYISQIFVIDSSKVLNFKLINDNTPPEPSNSEDDLLKS